MTISHYCVSYIKAHKLELLHYNWSEDTHELLVLYYWVVPPKDFHKLLLVSTIQMTFIKIKILYTTTPFKEICEILVLYYNWLIPFKRHSQTSFILKNEKCHSKDINKQVINYKWKVPFKWHSQTRCVLAYYKWEVPFKRHS